MAKNLVTLDLDNTSYEFRPYGTCSTAAATAAKSVAITGFTLCTGATVIVKFTTTNTATNPTLNVNSTGAKSLNLNNIKLIANNTYEFRYNGSSWDCISISDIQKATKNSIGGIKSANDRTTASNFLSGPINTGGTTATRYYGIEITSDGVGFVNVPWEGKNYTFGTGIESEGNVVSANVDKATIFAGSLTNINQAEATSEAIQLGQDCEWKNTGNKLSNVNDFVEYGIYNLYGERTRSNDNLPIQNTGGGNTFQGRLLVYDSSLPNTGNGGNDCCITQVLTLSNRVGGDGNTYIRTGVGSTASSLTWGTWGKLQTNVEVGQIPETNLANLIDNGMYSGVISYGSGSSLTTSSDPAITFVLITVNGYAAAAQAEVPACCTQLLYGISVGGTIVVKKRKGVKGTNNYFSFNSWEDLGGTGGISEIPVASSNTIGGIKTNFSTTGKNYQVKVNTDGHAYTEIGTATNSTFGVVKTAAVRIGTYSLNTGGTTSNRYYGVEIDAEGQLFVNVPWTASSTATASTTALAVTYKTLSSGSATISSLTKDTITRISTSTTAALTAVTGTLTISGFATKNSNKLTTYGLQFLVGSTNTNGVMKLNVPASVKWANGIEPILTGGEIIDIVFTTTDGTNFLGTWTKYY